MNEVIRDSTGRERTRKPFDGKSYDDHQLERSNGGHIDSLVIGYVLMEPWSHRVLLQDKTWGKLDEHEHDVAVFSCRVRANRAGQGWGASACVFPWEIESPEAQVDALVGR